MFLAWRDRRMPQEVGLAPGAGRRAHVHWPGAWAAPRGAGRPGRGQREVFGAARTGAGRNPSPPLLGALARALRLSDSQRDHLYLVAGVAPSSPRLVSQHIGPEVQRILDRLGDVPIGVFSAAWAVLCWNPIWAALTGDSSGQRGLDRNVVSRHFTHATSVIDLDRAHAEQFVDDLTADLREAAGRYRDDPTLAPPDHTPAGRLTRLCPSVAPGAHRMEPSSAKTATSTPVGPITIDCDVLTPPGTDLRIVMCTVAPQV